VILWQPKEFVIKQVPIPKINDDELLLKGMNDQVWIEL
jgi:hypothetical protein